MQKIEIRPYFGAHDREIRALILGIQNGEAGIGLSLREQPDLLDIRRAYQEPGGEFRLALSGGRAIGTIGLRMEPQHCAILKKFFVDAAHRSQGVGGALCRELPAFAMAAPGWSTSFWIPLRRPMPRTVSMSGPDSAPSPGRRFPFRIPTPTGTASSISQTCELPLPPRPPGQGPGRRTAGRAGREGRGSSRLPGGRGARRLPRPAHHPSPAGEAGAALRGFRALVRSVRPALPGGRRVVFPGGDPGGSSRASQHCVLEEIPGILKDPKNRRPQRAAVSVYSSVSSTGFP